MKLVFTKQAYDQLNIESQLGLTPIACDCRTDSKGDFDPACEDCEGHGLLFEKELSPESQAEIQENFRRQGIPLGKAGTQ
jgi:hypothetical protein